MIWYTRKFFVFMTFIAIDSLNIEQKDMTFFFYCIEQINNVWYYNTISHFYLF